VRTPNIIVVAANAKGEIVRYYEAGETAAYFGSLVARNAATGFYEPARDPRMIASTGKIIAAIAIANGGKDSSNSLYFDSEAPERGLETCAKGTGRHGRRAIVAFACSLNAPLLNRAALAGQARMRGLIDAFGFNMPPGDTPPSTAAVLGQISGAPQRVHQMSAVVLASLIGRGAVPVRQPTLVSRYDYTSLESLERSVTAQPPGIIPNKVIRRAAAPLLKALLSAPLCYTAGGAPAGTLKSLSRWCAGRRADVRLHFAKTGTQVAADRNATVDVWTTGAIQFANGAAYSYVVLTGTGSANQPWGTSLHAAQVAAPLLDVLLNDLAAHAKANPMPSLLPPRPVPRSIAHGSISGSAGQTRPN
jgi:membrane peptidoglycan carboxypeptidase